jgi:hypothetical protein
VDVEGVLLIQAGGVRPRATLVCLGECDGFQGEGRVCYSSGRIYGAAQGGFFFHVSLIDAG